jgi:hypothetical protein
MAEKIVVATSRDRVRDELGIAGTLAAIVLKGAIAPELDNIFDGAAVAPAMGESSWRTGGREGWSERSRKDVRRTNGLKPDAS